MKNQFWKVLLLSACVFADPSWAKDDFVEEFKAADFDKWEAIPTQADFSEGFLKLASDDGLIFVNSVNEFQNCEFTLKFSVGTVSAADDIFYYFGFQTVQPWMRDAIYVMLQGSSFVVMISKGGEVHFQESVPDISIVPHKQYELTIRWAPDSVTILVDGISIFFTDDPEKIPNASLYAYLAANRLGSESEAAVLNAYSLNITGL